MKTRFKSRLNERFVHMISGRNHHILYIMYTLHLHPLFTTLYRNYNLAWRAQIQFFMYMLCVFV